MYSRYQVSEEINEKICIQLEISFFVYIIYYCVFSKWKFIEFLDSSWRIWREKKLSSILKISFWINLEKKNLTLLLNLKICFMTQRY